jgi:hypothetical protein
MGKEREAVVLLLDVVEEMLDYLLKMNVEENDGRDRDGMVKRLMAIRKMNDDVRAEGEGSRPPGGKHEQ